MSIFTRKETVILKSEAQKDSLVEKLVKENVDFDVREDIENIYAPGRTWIIRIAAHDMKKVD